MDQTKEGQETVIPGGQATLSNGDFKYELVIQRLKQKEYRKVCFLVGAGISVAAGVPDFRSPGDGVYSKLEEFKLPFPEAAFEINYFKGRPEVYYNVKKKFLNQVKDAVPTSAHRFIKRMSEEGMLALCFSQNVDGLELKAGLPLNQLVQAHGHMRTAHCLRCNQTVDGEEMSKAIEELKVLHCQVCEGLVRPDTVFFGEQLPEQFVKNRSKIKEADLVIVMGTSLKVIPFASLTEQVGKVPILLLNRENSMVDSRRGRQVIHLQGDIEENVLMICRDLGWVL